MKRYVSLCFRILAVLLFVRVSYGDYLEISRRVRIKAEPVKGALAIETVERRTHVELLNNGIQENGYYQLKRAPLPKKLWPPVREFYSWL